MKRTVDIHIILNNHSSLCSVFRPLVVFLDSGAQWMASKTFNGGCSKLLKDQLSIIYTVTINVRYSRSLVDTLVSELGDWVIPFMLVEQTMLVPWL